MTEKELKKYFLSKLSLCYPSVHPDNEDVIIWIYDNKYIRNIKLHKLSNKHVELPDKVSGKALFVQDFRYSNMFLDGDDIWCEINKSLGYDKNNFYHNTYVKVKEYVKNTLINDDSIMIINNKISNYYKTTKLSDNYFLKKRIPQEILYLNANYSSDGGKIVYNLDDLIVIK